MRHLRGWNQDDAAEFVLQLLQLAAQRVDVLDPSYLAEMAQLGLVWATSRSCEDCGSTHCTNNYVSNHLDLRPATKPTSVQELCQASREEHLAEAGVCADCGEPCAVQRRPRIVARGNVLILRVVREKWCTASRRFKAITATTLDPSPVLRVQGHAYALRAVVVHRGSDPRAGHYGCYVPQGTWEIGCFTTTGSGCRSTTPRPCPPTHGS